MRWYVRRVRSVIAVRRQPRCHRLRATDLPSRPGPAPLSAMPAELREQLLVYDQLPNLLTHYRRAWP